MACDVEGDAGEQVVNVQLITELVQWFVRDAGGDVDAALAKLPNAKEDRWDSGMMADKDRTMEGSAILVPYYPCCPYRLTNRITY